MLKICAVLQPGIRDMRRREETDDEYSGRKGGRVDVVESVFGIVDLPETRSSVRSGSWAGLIGGAVMLLVLALSYDLAGGNPFLPLQVLAHGITGNAGLAGSAAGVGLAVFLVLSVSSVLGGLFGYLMSRFIGKLSLPGAAGVGMTYGLLVWIVIQFVVVASAAPDVILLYDQNALALAHGIYGICLGLFGRAYQKN